MSVKSLKKGDYVRVVSVEKTLEDTHNNHNIIKKSIGNIYRVETAADSLQKCILKSIDSVVYLYEDLELASASDLLPKGGIFNVQNLVC
jgi:hypothetical protein